MSLKGTRYFMLKNFSQNKNTAIPANCYFTGFSRDKSKKLYWNILEKSGVNYNQKMITFDKV